MHSHQYPIPVNAHGVIKFNSYKERLIIQAFSGYFGEKNKSKWAEHDATELIKKYKGPKLDILIDVGTGDNFYKQGQLLPENFEKAAKSAGLGDIVKVRYQEVSLPFESS